MCPRQGLSYWSLYSTIIEYVPTARSIFNQCWPYSYGSWNLPAVFAWPNHVHRFHGLHSYCSYVCICRIIRLHWRCVIQDFSIQKFPISLIHIQHLSQVWQPVPPAQDLAREHLQGVVEELDHLLHPLCSHLPLLQVAQLIGSSVSKVSQRCLKGVSKVSQRCLKCVIRGSSENLSWPWQTGGWSARTRWCSSPLRSSASSATSTSTSSPSSSSLASMSPRCFLHATYFQEKHQQLQKGDCPLVASVRCYCMAGQAGHGLGSLPAGLRKAKTGDALDLDLILEISKSGLRFWFIGTSCWVISLTHMI